jgi:hypothetical protein
MRDNWLSNRIFKSYDDLVDHCCATWNKLIDQPWRNHVHRIAPMGARVLIIGIWYYSQAGIDPHEIVRMTVDRAGAEVKALAAKRQKGASRYAKRS